MSKTRDLISVIHQYKFETGKTEFDMHDVARFAMQKLGWRPPQPRSPEDLLARELSKAARQEVRYDDKGRPYRAYHSADGGSSQTTFWFDIDGEVPRNLMHNSLIKRRDQMVGDALQLSLDADHWNDRYPTEEPIQIPLDFHEDVAERKASTLDEVG